MTSAVGLALGLMLLPRAGRPGKRGAAAGVQAHHFIMLQGWFFLPGVGLYGLLTGTLELAATCCGVWRRACSFSSRSTTSRAPKSGSASVIAPIFRLSFIVTTTLAARCSASRSPGGSSLALRLRSARSGCCWAAMRARCRCAARRAPRLLGRSSRWRQWALPIFSTRSAQRREVTRPRSLPARRSCSCPRHGIRLENGRRNPAATPRLALRGNDRGAVSGRARHDVRKAFARGEASVLVPITQMGFVVTAAVGVIFLREPFLSARRDRERGRGARVPRQKLSNLWSLRLK